MSGFFNLGGSSKEQNDKSDDAESPTSSGFRPTMSKLLKRNSTSKKNVVKEDTTSVNSKRSRVPMKLWSSTTSAPPEMRSSSTRDESSSSNGERQVKRSSMGHVGVNFMNTVMAPVVAGKAVVQGGVKAGQSVVNAGAAMGTTVGNSMAYGGKAVRDSGKAIVSKGAKGMVQGIKSVTTLGGIVNRNQGKVKSKWEEGIEVIDSILDPSSEAYQAMTRKQRKGLARVRKILINGATGSDKTEHIPRDLIQMDKQNERLTKSNPSASTATSRASTKFLLQEYAGVKSQGQSHALGDLAEWDDLSDSDSESEDADEPNLLACVKEEECGRANGSRKSSGISRTLSDLAYNEDMDLVNYVPIEFKRMTKDDQLELFKTLSWNNLKNWDFDVFKLNTLTRRRPLMFIAWAILGAPYSQKAMANHIGLDYGNDDDMLGYPFMDDLSIPPNKLLDYLRIIELDYHAVNPYHNAIHAADVLQTLHTLIQSSLNEDFLVDCSSVKLFAILLAAVIHDVDHPGKTNAFHTSMRTELAVMYNDKSVLENWHVAHAFSRMLDIQLLGTRNIHESQVLKMGEHADEGIRECDTNLLSNISADQFKTIRNLMIEAVLHTDMTKHFEMVNASKGLLMQSKSDEKTWKVLMFMLHMADISSQAKAEPLFHQWTNRCMDEFFNQGDEEARLGLAISPNCDRDTTSKPESQVGFIRFVVEPAFEVLGSFIPFVEDEVMPIIDGNLDYWVAKFEEETAASTTANVEQKEKAIENKNPSSGSKEEEESAPKQGKVPTTVTLKG